MYYGPMDYLAQRVYGQAQPPSFQQYQQSLYQPGTTAQPSGPMMNDDPGGMGVVPPSQPHLVNSLTQAAYPPSPSPQATLGGGSFGSSYAGPPTLAPDPGLGGHGGQMAAYPYPVAQPPVAPYTRPVVKYPY